MSIKTKKPGATPNGFPRVIPAQSEDKYDALQHVHRLQKELKKAKKVLRDVLAVCPVDRWTREEIKDVLAGSEH